MIKKTIVYLLLLSLLGSFFSSCGKGTSGKRAESMDQFALTKDDISIKEKGISGNGTTDETKAISDLIQNNKDSGKRIFFTKGTYLIKGTLNFPSSMSVAFEDGAVMKIAETGYVAFNCTVGAGNYKVFENSGTLKINTVTKGNPFWFGAKGDGKTDDTAAFVMAFKVFNELGLPYTEGGFVISSLNTFKNMNLTGIDTSKKSVIKAKSDTKRLIYTDTGLFKISNISFDMSAAPDASTVVYFDTAKAYIEKVYINNCDFYDAYHVFTDAKSVKVMMFMYFTYLGFYRSRNSTFVIEDFEGFIFLKKIKIDNSESYTTHKLKDSFPAIQIDDVRGTIFESMEVIGGNSGFSSETGFYIPGLKATMASVWWDRVKVRNMSGYGITLGQTYICSFINTEVENCGGGFKISKGDQLQFQNVAVKNCKATVSAIESNGIMLSNCTKSQLNNVVCEGNSGNGIILNSCKNVSVANSKFLNNDSLGYKDNGGKQNIFVNSESMGNQEGQVAVTGTGGRIDNIVVKKDQKGISFDGIGKDK